MSFVAWLYCINNSLYFCVRQNRGRIFFFPSIKARALRGESKKCFAFRILGNFLVFLDNSV